MIDEQAIAKAGQAKQELAVVDEAFALVRQTALEAIVKGDPGEQRRIDRLVMTVQIIDSVRKVIEEVIANGTVAEASAALRDAGFFKPN